MRVADVEVKIGLPLAPEAVWPILADPARMARYSPETTGVRASRSGVLRVGDRFSGANRRGAFAWTTQCHVVESVPGASFAFDVTFWGLSAARWRFEAKPSAEGCTVIEQWWDRRGPIMHVLSRVGTGVRDRTTHNRQTMSQTLAALRDDVVSGDGSG